MFGLLAGRANKSAVLLWPVGCPTSAGSSARRVSKVGMTALWLKHRLYNLVFGIGQNLNFLYFFGYLSGIFVLKIGLKKVTIECDKSEKCFIKIFF